MILESDPARALARAGLRKVLENMLQRNSSPARNSWESDFPSIFFEGTKMNLKKVLKLSRKLPFEFQTIVDSLRDTVFSSKIPARALARAGIQLKNMVSCRKFVPVCF